MILIEFMKGRTALLGPLILTRVLTDPFFRKSKLLRCAVCQRQWIFALSEGIMVLGAAWR